MATATACYGEIARARGSGWVLVVTHCQHQNLLQMDYTLEEVSQNISEKFSHCTGVVTGVTVFGMIMVCFCCFTNYCQNNRNDYGSSFVLGLMILACMLIPLLTGIGLIIGGAVSG